MAPIFYCKCSNCIPTASVLLKQERLGDKNTKEEGTAGDGQGVDEGQEDGEGQEYTYLMSGWDRPTDDKDSGMMGSIVMVVVLLLSGDSIIQNTLS